MVILTLRNYPDFSSIPDLWVANLELSKSDKRIARTIIQKGLMNEFAKGLNKADEILNDWKQGKGDARESYHALFKHISGFDKGIASRYNGMGNSDLLDVILQQLNEKLIEKADLDIFSDDGKSIFQRIFSSRNM